jgi:hypothetical protein
MKGLLSKIEVLVIGAFVLIFLIWAASKCSSNREKLREEAAAEAQEDSIANARQNLQTQTNQPVQPPAAVGAATQPGATVAQPAANPATSATNSASGAAQPSNAGSTQTSTAKPASTAQEPQLSRLYVTIDKLKLRKSPGLKSEILGELKLFDEVFFMNESTDSTYQLNLGKEIADEPYVKIKTKRGTVGWVYGAGVHYLKKKRPGTLE